MSKKAWGGRFAGDLAKEALEYSASVDIDCALVEEDIAGSLAHVAMLGAQGILTKEEQRQIEDGLKAIREDARADKLTWNAELEDIHLNVEAELTQRVGDVGGKLHTGRSRNDQVATDMRMWTRQACLETMARIESVQHVLIERSRELLDVIMPGYTHLQRAQPVRLSHHLLAWAEMLERDFGRLLDAKSRLNECPLGSGALATTTFEIDREAVSHSLGFRAPTRNSLDSVSDRDFLLETVSALSICAVHLSRIAEELILWSSQEFGFISFSDQYATGSSMMPQKKNPDMAELMRGKSASVVGDLVTLLTLMKSLPLTYNRDMQEDKAPTFRAFQTVQSSLSILAGMLREVAFDADRMRDALREGFVEATELADYLSARGVPFREAHRVAGQAVALALRSSKTLSELTLEELQDVDPRFDRGVHDVLDLERMVERRKVYGGPARDSVSSRIEEFVARVAAHDASL